MSLRDKKRAKNRRKRAQKKNRTPEHKELRRTLRELDALNEEVVRLEALYKAGKKYLRSRELAESMSAFHGKQHVLDAIYLYKHPVLLEQVRQRIALLEGQAIPEKVTEQVPEPEQAPEQVAQEMQNGDKAQS